jgi:hypothetical protein
MAPRGFQANFHVLALLISIFGYQGNPSTWHPFSKVGRLLERQTKFSRVSPKQHSLANRKTTLTLSGDSAICSRGVEDIRMRCTGDEDVRMRCTGDEDVRMRCTGDEDIRMRCTGDEDVVKTLGGDNIVPSIWMLLPILQKPT